MLCSCFPSQMSQHAIFATGVKLMPLWSKLKTRDFLGFWLDVSSSTNLRGRGGLAKRWRVMTRLHGGEGGSGNPLKIYEQPLMRWWSSKFRMDGWMGDDLQKEWECEKWKDTFSAIFFWAEKQVWRMTWLFLPTSLHPMKPMKPINDR